MIDIFLSSAFASHSHMSAGFRVGQASGWADVNSVKLSSCVKINISLPSRQYTPLRKHARGSLFPYSTTSTLTAPSQLILISGYPSSGKTHRSNQLLAYFTDRISSSTDPRTSKLKLHHLTDQNLGLDRDVYTAARSEKDARATLSSAIKRHLTANDVVVVDAMNYIKGFRYQMFCEAKAQRTPSCVVHIGTRVEKCREMNEKALADGSGGYAPELFENLVFRYEEPNGMSRWDSPLFTVPYDDETPPLEEIWDTMVGGKAKAVKPNSATVLAPATEQNYLYELDKTTSDIVAQISAWQKDHPGESGGDVTIPGAQNTIELPANTLGLPQLQRMRRQFISMNRTHNLSKDRIKDLFVDYLNDTFQAA